jgi:hypothetical protein
MAAFMTSCEAYMGIEPHFDVGTRLQQGSDAEAVVLGSVDLFVLSELGAYPYFHLPMSGSPVRWQKIWFFLRNDADTLLPVFTGSRLIPQPKWGYGVAQKDLHKLQPLCEVIQWLIRGDLIGADLL